MKRKSLKQFISDALGLNNPDLVEPSTILWVECSDRNSLIHFRYLFCPRYTQERLAALPAGPYGVREMALRIERHSFLRDITNACLRWVLLHDQDKLLKARTSKNHDSKLQAIFCPGDCGKCKQAAGLKHYHDQVLNRVLS